MSSQDAKGRGRGDEGRESKEADDEVRNDVSPALDPFDPGRLRLSQGFDNVGVKKVLTSVPVRKPNKHRFVRVHPDAAMHIETLVLELKEERETYLIDPSLAEALWGDATPKVLKTYVDRQGTVGLWPIRLPGPDGRLDEWNKGALEAAEMATTQWIRIAANMGLGSYDVFVASGDLGEPTWPENITLAKLLRIAFKDTYIDDLNHQVLRKLRGEF